MLALDKIRSSKSLYINFIIMIEKFYSNKLCLYINY